MKVRVKVPKLGLTIEEVSLTSWEKNEGDAVAVDEPIATVEGDKASFEVVSPASGVLLKQVASVGETLPVGGEIAVIEV